MSILGYWVDLYALETKLRSLQPQDKGKVVKAVDMINECVKEWKNTKISSLFSLKFVDIWVERRFLNKKIEAFVKSMEE